VLAELPALLILVGLGAYAVLAGADFGAGFWTLLSIGGRASPEATRDHARNAMGPVWEANHVWLIFVLVVCWTAYPVAFASILSTLSIPLFVAAVGIILRGASYALRGTLGSAPGHRLVENVFALSSILTPLALGAVVGAIASERVPVGNALGDPVRSWLNPTSVLVGILLVATSSYLAAVYLAADAHRVGEPNLERDFRARALGAGLVAGAIALLGPLVLRSDAPRIWDGLTSGSGLAMVLLSSAAGAATLLWVWHSRFGRARVSAALAVAAIVAGFGFAQYPEFLPGLRIDQAVAGDSTLLAVTIAVAAGAIVLVPSLLLLFGLFLRGRLAIESNAETSAFAVPRVPAPDHSRGLGAFALACLLAGAGLMLFADAGWGRALGVAALFGTAASGFGLVATSTDERAES
jgi:cytochrome d ubiquinol oxidase subunit II